MGCFGSKEEGEPKQAARRQSDGGGSGRDRKQSRFETDINTPPVEKLPEPDKRKKTFYSTFFSLF